MHQAEAHLNKRNVKQQETKNLIAGMCLNSRSDTLYKGPEALGGLRFRLGVIAVTAGPPIENADNFGLDFDFELLD